MLLILDKSIITQIVVILGSHADKLRIPVDEVPAVPHVDLVIRPETVDQQGEIEYIFAPVVASDMKDGLMFPDR